MSPISLTQELSNINTFLAGSSAHLCISLNVRRYQNTWKPISWAQLAHQMLFAITTGDGSLNVVTKVGCSQLLHYVSLQLWPTKWVNSAEIALNYPKTHYSALKHNFLAFRLIPDTNYKMLIHMINSVHSFTYL